MAAEAVGAAPAEVQRKLASIRRVAAVRPIAGADMIEVALIDGWEVVVKKGEVEAGALAVYFEIDALLPVEDRYEFLRASSFRKISDEVSGFRLKTIKLRGQVSQGLVLPLASFPELAGAQLGDDVTDALRVVKFEVPDDPETRARMTGKARGLFPSFIRKTDEERIQNLPSYFAADSMYRDVEFEITIKLDGTSFTAYFRDGDTGVCSRNLNLVEEQGNLYWDVAKSLNILDRLRAYGRNLAIQGEIIGEGIQGNNERISGHELFVFSIYDIDRSRYVGFAERQQILADLNAAGGPEIKHTPVLGIEPIFRRFATVAELLSFATGPSMRGAKREGLVFKSAPVNGYVVSFKAISNEYLLAEGKAPQPLNPSGRAKAKAARKTRSKGPAVAGGDAAADATAGADAAADATEGADAADAI